MATGGKKPGIRDIGDFVQVFDKICQTLAKYKDKFYKFTKDAARKIRLRLHGKQIAVLGPVAAGKTTLLHVLKDPSVVIDPMTYEKTTDAVNFADRLLWNGNCPLTTWVRKRKSFASKLGNRRMLAAKPHRGIRKPAGLMFVRSQTSCSTYLMPPPILRTELWLAYEKTSTGLPTTHKPSLRVSKSSFLPTKLTRLSET